MLPTRGSNHHKLLLLLLLLLLLSLWYRNGVQSTVRRLAESRWFTCPCSIHVAC
jgi:hypothetical protein